MYDEETGEAKTFHGKPVPRPPNTHPPCRYQDPKKPQGRCPKGTPENQKSLTEKNLLAWQHYLECKAVGDFPDDPIVRSNAGIIRRIEDSLQDQTRRMIEVFLKTPRM